MMKTFGIAAASFAVLSLWAGATLAAAGHAGHGHGIGEAGDPAKSSRLIRVEATDDMRFRPAAISVKPGETVTFVVVNKGKLKHEFMLGSTKDLKDHAAEMAKNPEMEHDDDNVVSLEPGETKRLVWRFTRSGRVDFGCLVPGHYDGGMHGRISIGPAGARQ